MMVTKEPERSSASVRSVSAPISIDWSQADARVVKLKQDPGPQNALGLVRIDMQNEHGVYMHDTPMKPLFDQRARAFSAGCVRVQDVFQLVEWIARFEPGWEQPGQVRAVLEQGQALDLNLTRPVPVYFTYITAWAEADGQVQFRPDLYKRDGAQAVVALLQSVTWQQPSLPRPVVEARLQRLARGALTLQGAPA